MTLQDVREERGKLASDTELGLLIIKVYDIFLGQPDTVGPPDQSFTQQLNLVHRSHRHVFLHGVYRGMDNLKVRCEAHYHKKLDEAFEETWRICCKSIANPEEQC